MRPMIPLGLAAAALLAPWDALPALAAQDVRYTTVTRTELGGSLGRMSRLFGGGGPTTETYWYSGPRLRTDRGDENSNIVDAAAATIVELEHRPRTYWLWSMDEPLFEFEVGGDDEDVWDDVDDEEMPRAQRRPRTRYEIALSTERGRRARLVGLDAQQVFVTLTVTGETVNETTDEVERGSMVVLSELWLTDHFPGTAAEEAFARAWAERNPPVLDSVEVARAQESMERVYQEDPRIGIAMARLDSALAALEGTTLKSMSHFVVVPDGARFDREAVLRDADRTLAQDAAGAAARGAAAQGRRTVGRLTGGRIGGGQREPQPVQAVIMRTRYEVTELSTDPIPADKFQPPANYRRRTPGGEN